MSRADRELRRPGHGGRPSLRERLANRAWRAVEYVAIAAFCIVGGAVIDAILHHAWS